MNKIYPDKIYLDNAASTKPSAEAMEVFADVSLNAYANASSLHNMGMAAEKHIKDAKNIFAKTLGVQPKNILFTSGGTESNNMAVTGTAIANCRRGKHIISTAVEHPSVLETCKHLASIGYEVDFLSVDKNGTIDIDEFCRKLRDDTVLVSVMHVNNEVGTVQPVHLLKDIMRKKSPNALLHTDAVQSFGKEPIDINAWGIDLLSASSHKIYSPKGTGLLYIGDKVKIEPLLYGGAHQGGLRSGTENTAGTAAFACSVSCLAQESEKHHAYVSELNTALRRGILSRLDRVQINSPSDASPYICNVSFFGVRSEILLHSLESKGIYVSSGSACSSHKSGKSHVLAAMGLNYDGIDSALRFSFSHENTLDEIAYTVDTLAEQVSLIRKYTRK